MKIQFIIAGWYYNQDSLINGLIELNKTNKEVNVFYACHKEPTEYVKDNFDWKLFDNVGEEIVAYQQAIEMLEWTTSDSIELSKREFEEYVRNNWSWKESFKTSNMTYMNNISGSLKFDNF